MAAGPADAPAVDEPPEQPELPLPPPGEIRAITPPMTDRKAGEDWNKIVDALYDQRFARAQQQLGDFEKRWGESRETRNLRKQLEQLPAEAFADD